MIFLMLQFLKSDKLQLHTYGTELVDDIPWVPYLTPLTILSPPNFLTQIMYTLPLTAMFYNTNGLVSLLSLVDLVLLLSSFSSP